MNFIRNWERQGLRHRPQCDEVDLQGVHANGVFPSQFVRVRGANRTVPTNPVEHLNVIQVEVNGMGVHAVMDDFPYLAAVAGRAQIQPRVIGEPGRVARREWPFHVGRITWLSLTA